MTGSPQLTARLAAALEDVPGLRLAVPRATLPWHLDGLAVEVTPGLVEVRVVGLALPIRPVLAQAEAALRDVLTGTAWEHARLRLVVTDLDACAVSDCAP